MYKNIKLYRKKKQLCNSKSIINERINKSTVKIVTFASEDVTQQRNSRRPCTIKEISRIINFVSNSKRYCSPSRSDLVGTPVEL